MSAQLMRSYLDILNENAFKQEYRLRLEQQGIEVTELMLDEGWKSKLAAAGLAGAMALGSLAPAQAAQPSDAPITQPAAQSAKKAVGKDAEVRPADSKSTTAPKVKHLKDISDAEIEKWLSGGR